jgi:hypothetical protein
MGVNYQVLLGTDQVSDDYGNVQYLPTTFYVDRNGIIVDKAPGLFSREEIENDVKKILASGQDPGAAQTSRASVVKASTPTTKDAQ